MEQFREKIKNQITVDLSNAATAAVRILHGLAVNASEDGIKLKAANSILEHFKNFPPQLPDSDSRSRMFDDELECKLEVAYSAGKYGFVLAGDRILPPEIEDRIPTDTRAQAKLLALVEEKLGEMREDSDNTFARAETSAVSARIEKGFS